ncbi:tetratricopeptide repeat protein [Methylomagnum ishizawai]|uniref:tetratricopeptide repeat-containing glycosyltransferase family protein n=1 Tax=Methylomagnum ishizawai TaxID=1760988 RepID=UPI001C33998C|nr:tetratricopeptide repeat-containing glycosyltransferase family protein [Methylomagnum ishizawai]BBL74432.1 hypothetical protein MishRS11D_15300 [Methylomagnum ishizawai]
MTADPLFTEGNRLMAAGEAEAAERCFRLALALRPDFPEALTNLGLLREQAGALDEAEACHRRAIALRPDQACLQLNLGVMLMNARRYPAAETHLRQALDLAPDSAAAWSNLGVLMIRTQREDAAERCLRTAIGLDPAYAKARFNLAYGLLRQGRYEEGWECLEARDWYAMLDRHFTCPRWRGEDLAGKSLLIGLEAGHGDMIQFCRYGPLLKRMGAARITVLCHPGLKTLFATLSGIDEVVSVAEDVPAAGWDCWTPPLSLPYHCRTRLDSIPAPIPYLSADPARVARWSPRLPQGKRVGLVWKGNSRFENDAERSLPALDPLAPLGQVPGIQFVSLQKGAGEDEALNPPSGFNLLALGHELADFADTAAVLAGLDLVISVDTAVAHLAGAMGKPCWVLLPDHMTDWRWLKDRLDSPWYPGTMRLFRQPTGGGWIPVVAAVAQALAAWSENTPFPR